MRLVTLVSAVVEESLVEEVEEKVEVQGLCEGKVEVKPGVNLPRSLAISAEVN